DNSGLATAMALADLVHRRRPDVVPVILRIGYAVQPTSAAAARWGPSPGWEPWAEALSPVRAVLNARDAHTANQIAALERLRHATAVGDSATAAVPCRSGCQRSRRHPILAAELLLEKGKV